MTKYELEDLEGLVDVYTDCIEAHKENNQNMFISKLMVLGHIIQELVEINTSKLGFTWDYHDCWKNHS